MTNLAMERFAVELARKDAEIVALKAALSGRTVSCVCGGNAARNAELHAQVGLMNTRARYDAVAFERDEKERVALMAQVKIAKADAFEEAAIMAWRKDHNDLQDELEKVVAKLREEAA